MNRDLARGVVRAAFVAALFTAAACSNTAESAASPDGSAGSGGSAGTGENTGGAPSPSGGSVAAGAGASGGGANTGGAVSNGGSSTGGAGAGETGGAGAGENGGAVSTGGKTGNTGGSSTGGASAGAGGTGTNADAGASETKRVSDWLTDTSSGLPNYAYTNITKNFATTEEFDTLVHAIVTSCTEFAPAEANWTVYCEAVLTSAIVAESSYDPTEDVTDSYATRTVGTTTADDPTVGLLQVRFSSTVHDYNYYGPFEKIAAIGCVWPAELETQADDATFWATEGGTQYLSFMKDPSCNIGLAAWYYLMNATGNGGANPVYAYDYCNGNGIAGDMVIGLLSHLEGPGFQRPPDATNPYVTGIKSRFASLLGGLPSPDPFTESLAPERSKYCR